MIMIHWCNNINRENAKVLGAKPAPVPHFPPCTPHSQVWNQTWVTSQQLVTWTMVSVMCNLVQIQLLTPRSVYMVSQSKSQSSENLSSQKWEWMYSYALHMLLNLLNLLFKTYKTQAVVNPLKKWKSNESLWSRPVLKQGLFICKSYVYWTCIILIVEE